MDLGSLRGIAPLERSRLVDAGVPTAESFAWVDDLRALSARTSIPVARLTALQGEAVRAVGRSVRPPPVAFRSALSSLMDLARTVRSTWRL